MQKISNICLMEKTGIVKEGFTTRLGGVKPLAILTELTKRILEQSYMDKQKGVSASSIVKKQFGKNRSSNTARLDESAERKINIILFILDYNKELPVLRKENDEDIDIRDIALQDAYKKELRIKKSCI